MTTGQRICCGIAALIAATSAPAASITFSAPATCAGDSDVSTAGALKFAYDWANSAQTVNGVAFAGTTATTTVGPDLAMGWLGGGTDNPSAFSSASNPFASLSSAYRAILSGAVYAGTTGAGTASTITLTGLTVGRPYLVQFWVNDARGSGGGGARTQSIVSGGNTVTAGYGSATAGTPGQYVVGTFTADATNQTITLTALTGPSPTAQMNALQLRDLAPPATFYWDPDGDVAGLGGSGTWDLASSAWTPDAGGASGNTTYANDLTTAAVLGGSSGMVTLAASTTIKVHTITFATPGYTIAGASGSVLNASGLGALTIATGDGCTGTINAAIAGTAGLTKTGDSGTLVLAGTNTYAGATTIQGGTLQVTGLAQFQNSSAINVGPSGTLDVAAAPATWSAPPVGGSGAWNLNGSQTTWTHATANLTNFTGTLNIGPSIGFYGDGVNNYPGAGATINVASGAELNVYQTMTSPTGTVHLFGGIGPSWDNTRVALRTVNAGTVRYNIQIHADTAIGHYPGQGGGVYTGEIDLGGHILTVSIPAGSPGNLTLNSALSGSGVLTTTNANFTFLYLGGSNGAFTGTFQPGSGAEMTFMSSAAGSSNAVARVGVVSGNTWLQWGAASNGTVQLGALTDGGYASGILQNINPNNGTLCTFEVGALGTSTTFGGVLRDSYTSGSSKIALRKVGAGTLTLTGANTFTGGTTIDGGALQLGDGTNANGALQGNVTNNAMLIVANPIAQTLAGVISGSGSLAKWGGGALTLSASNTYGGPTVVSNGGTARVTTNLPAGLQIMPMGDSITYGGSGTQGGYRGYLYARVAPLAPGFQFVGASVQNPSSLPTAPIDQTHHNGYSSYSTVDLKNNLDGLDTRVFTALGGADRNPNGGYWLVGSNGTGRAAAFPDVVLIMVGANDVYWGNQGNGLINPANYAANLGALVDKITTLRTNARVIVADITPWPAQAAAVAALNSNVNTVVADRQAQGRRVTRVDLNTSFPAGGLSADGLHPNDTGYAWMAEQWYGAILAACSNDLILTTGDTNGTLFVTGALGTGAVTVASGATLGGSGVINGPVTSNGRVAPGTNGLGTLTLANDFTLSTNGALTIELAGPGSNDTLAVTGAAILDGTLQVTFTNGYAGNLGDTFTILTASSISGPAATNLPALDGGAAWSVRNTGTTLVLAITNAAPTGYAAWAAAITNGLTNVNDSASGDGYPNLLKYATGGSPTGADSLARLSGTWTGGLFGLQFHRNTAATDVTLIAEAAFAIGDGTDWVGLATNRGGSWGGAANVSEVTNTVPATVVVSDPGIAAANRFLRLRVTRP